MTTQKIKKDVADEFVKLREALQIYLHPGFDVSQTKQFLQSHVPKEILFKSELLLDTLLNYLMEDAQQKIKNADTKLQNAFFDANFRKSLKVWTKQLENQLALESDIVKYTYDPRLKQGLIASGITFVAGSSVTLTLAPTVVGAIVSGFVTILLSVLAFKIGYDKASPKARDMIKMDIDQYLKTSEMLVLEWLEKVGDVFKGDFQDFCEKNGFVL